MKSHILLFIISIFCSYLWWSCACDSIGDIPSGSQHADSGPNTVTVPQGAENVNMELDSVANNEHSSEEKNVIGNLETKKQSIEKEDLSVPSFSEIIDKPQKEHNPKQGVKKKLKSASDETIKKPNIAKEVDPRESSRFEGNSTASAEQSIQGSMHVENQVEAPRTSESVDLVASPSIAVEVADNLVSPNASPDLVKVPEEENISPSSVADNIETPEHGQHPHSEAMPSFDEWKKMMLTEQEKGGHEVPQPGPPGKKIAGQKRRRNYASYECGAKIVASNAEAEGTSRILNGLVDEYMLNPCQAKIWFVIELCESVQASQIELANFELFSSCPKDFAVYASDNFPTRDWIPLGGFSAAEQRVLQSFQLKQEGYGKFIKIELQSHYGKEHYCPLSVVRIFGTSMVDEYEEMETLSNHVVLLDDELDRLDLPVEDESPTNLFGSATDAVYNIVKKAAQVLVPQQIAGGESADTVEQNISDAERCKLLDNECKDKNKSDSGTLPKDSPSGFVVSATSIHRTLFHHLRRCEQCVKASQPSYYSISEPQCRFFQVALGPVLFASICDWFRDHHLPIITHQVPIVDVKRNVSNTILKPTSPPPSVIRVIIDRNQSESRSLPASSDTSSTSRESKDILRETSELPTDLKSISSTSTGMKVDSAIKPTKTIPAVKERSHVDISGTITTDTSYVLQSDIKDSLNANGEPIIDIPVPGPSPINTVLDVDEVLSPTLTAIPPIESSVVSNETKVTSQGFDRLDEEVIASTMELATEDFTEELRTGDDKFTDVKDSTVKLETVMVGGTTGQKESVFIRMNNRIKALELNMSLSSQYLQELSQRYRRQMEEMQRAFNRTIGTLNDTAKKAAEKDQKQQEVIGYLQSQVANLTVIVDELITERNAVLRRTIEIHVFLMVVQAIIMITIMSLCVRRVSSSTSSQPLSHSVEQGVVPLTGRKRRSSTDSSPTSTVPKVKKRSASEEVLSSGNELLIIEPPVVVPLPKVRKRNKKKKNIQRSLSNPSMSPTKNSTSPIKKKTRGDDSCAAGIIFSSADAKNSTKEIRNLGYACENCNKGSSASDCGVKSYATTKENRKNYSPLKNLTNGDLESHQRTILPIGLFKEKERFSFKKFLKFQKRESI